MRENTEEPAPVGGRPFGLSAAAEIARRTKRDMVRQYGESRDQSRADLTYQAIAAREGQAVAQLGADRRVDDAVLSLVYQAASLFQADQVFVIADSTFRRLRPESEEAEALSHYRRGDMQRDWREGRRQGLTEALVVTRLAPEEEPELLVYPYRRRGRRLRWEEPDMPEGATVQGALPDAAQRGFQAAKFTERVYDRARLEAAQEGLSGLSLAYSMSRGAARVASEAEGVGLVCVYGRPAGEADSFFRDGREVTYDSD